MITISDLRAGYGKLEILHDVNMRFMTQQFTSLLGPNGSGKSTLLKSIFGITNIFDGSIQFAEHELTGLPTSVIGRLGIAYVPQRDNIFPAMTVRDNLLLAARKMKKHTRNDVLAQTYHLFPILEKRLSQRTGQLSGGERQMVAMAIGWLMQPKVMLLDEPTAGLAPRIAAEVLKTLQTFRDQGITLIVVEQNARSVLRWCDYVYVMREGQIKFHGTAEECLADEETIKSYLGVESGHRFFKDN